MSSEPPGRKRTSSEHLGPSSSTESPNPKRNRVQSPSSARTFESLQRLASEQRWCEVIENVLEHLVDLESKKSPAARRGSSAISHSQILELEQIAYGNKSEPHYQFIAFLLAWCGVEFALLSCSQKDMNNSIELMAQITKDERLTARPLTSQPTSSLAQDKCSTSLPFPVPRLSSLCCQTCIQTFKNTKPAAEPERPKGVNPKSPYHPTFSDTFDCLQWLASTLKVFVEQDTDQHELLNAFMFPCLVVATKTYFLATTSVIQFSQIFSKENLLEESIQIAGCAFPQQVKEGHVQFASMGELGLTSEELSHYLFSLALLPSAPPTFLCDNSTFHCIKINLIRDWVKAFWQKDPKTAEVRESLLYVAKNTLIENCKSSPIPFLSVANKISCFKGMKPIFVYQLACGALYSDSPAKRDVFERVVELFNKVEKRNEHIIFQDMKRLLDDSVVAPSAMVHACKWFLDRQSFDCSLSLALYALKKAEGESKQEAPIQRFLAELACTSAISVFPILQPDDSQDQPQPQSSSSSQPPVSGSQPIPEDQHSTRFEHVFNRCLESFTKTSTLQTFAEQIESFLSLFETSDDDMIITTSNFLLCSADLTIYGPPISTDPPEERHLVFVGGLPGYMAKEQVMEQAEIDFSGYEIPEFVMIKTQSGLGYFEFSNYEDARQWRKLLKMETERYPIVQQATSAQECKIFELMVPKSVVKNMAYEFWLRAVMGDGDPKKGTKTEMTVNFLKKAKEMELDPLPELMDLDDRDVLFGCSLWLMSNGRFEDAMKYGEETFERNGKIGLHIVGRFLGKCCDIKGDHARKCAMIDHLLDFELMSLTLSLRLEHLLNPLPLGGTTPAKDAIDRALQVIEKEVYGITDDWDRTAMALFLGKCDEVHNEISLLSPHFQLRILCHIFKVSSEVSPFFPLHGSQATQKLISPTIENIFENCTDMKELFSSNFLVEFVKGHAGLASEMIAKKLISHLDTQRGLDSSVPPVERLQRRDELRRWVRETSELIRNAFKMAQKPNEWKSCFERVSSVHPDACYDVSPLARSGWPVAPTPLDVLSALI